MRLQYNGRFISATSTFWNNKKKLRHYSMRKHAYFRSIKWWQTLITPMLYMFLHLSQWNFNRGWIIAWRLLCPKSHPLQDTTSTISLPLQKNTIQIPLNGTRGYNGQWYLNGIWMVSEWYLNFFEWYFGFCVTFSGIEWYLKLPLRIPLIPAEISLMLNDIQWYWIIYHWLFFVRVLTQSGEMTLDFMYPIHRIARPRPFIIN